MKKKKIIVFIVIIVLFIVLIPIPKRLDDNGSKEYKSLLYKYTKLRYYSDLSTTGYIDRWELRILGIRVGGNVDTEEKKVQKNMGSVFIEVIEDTRTSKGATFIIKNTTDDEYCYGEPYSIEKYENQTWKELDTLTGVPLSWNEILYVLKSKEETKLNINWSLGYGELKSGTYRLVKNDIRKLNSPDSRAYTIYAIFNIK